MHKDFRLSNAQVNAVIDSDSTVGHVCVSVGMNVGAPTKTKEHEFAQGTSRCNCATLDGGGWMPTRLWSLYTSVFAVARF